MLGTISRFGANAEQVAKHEASHVFSLLSGNHVSARDFVHTFARLTNEIGKHRALKQIEVTFMKDYRDIMQKLAMPVPTTDCGKKMYMKFRQAFTMSQLSEAFNPTEETEADERFHMMMVLSGRRGKEEEDAVKGTMQKPEESTDAGHTH